MKNQLEWCYDLTIVQYTQCKLFMVAFKGSKKDCIMFYSLDV